MYKRLKKLKKKLRKKYLNFKRLLIFIKKYLTKHDLHLSLIEKKQMIESLQIDIKNFKFVNKNLLILTKLKQFFLSVTILKKINKLIIKPFGIKSNIRSKRYLQYARIIVNKKIYFHY